MICTTCSKLLLKVVIKNCFKCKKEIKLNIQTICDDCSNESKTCSSCLKKMIVSDNSKTKSIGCSSCRKKR